MPGRSVGVDVLDTNYTTDIKLELAFADPNSVTRDVVDVLGDAHSYVEVQTDVDYSLAAYCNQMVSNS